MIHEGQYAAEVDVELIETDESWSPYLSIDDAYKLDDVRDALRRGAIRSAAHQSRLFTRTPMADGTSVQVRRNAQDRGSPVFRLE